MSFKYILMESLIDVLRNPPICVRHSVELGGCYSGISDTRHRKDIGFSGGFRIKRFWGSWTYGSINTIYEDWGGPVVHEASWGLWQEGWQRNFWEKKKKKLNYDHFYIFSYKILASEAFATFKFIQYSPLNRMLVVLPFSGVSGNHGLPTK